MGSDVGAVSDQLKDHTQVGGVAGLLVAALLVLALPLVKQSPGLDELGNAYANFYNTGILHFAAWIAFGFASAAANWDAQDLEPRASNALPSIANCACAVFSRY